MAYKDGKPGGFDPHKRIPDMDADGIDAVFLYPSLGLFSGAIHDPELAAATCRAYNRWLADYCKPYPDRLFGVAMLPMQSIDLAIAEMRFARKELGFRGGFLRPNPYNNKMIHHPDYEPFWAAAEDLDFSIGFHEGASSGMPTVGVDRFEGRGAQHIISHTMEMMLACMSVIWGGVCERHPKIRIAFLESGAVGSRPGSTGWTVTSTIRGSTIPASPRARASSFGAIAGSRSSRSRGASRCSPTISGRTRSYGRPTTRTRTASSPVRRK
jgi:predicted TIM-barrel fold metal-dependent hydrolase